MLSIPSSKSGVRDGAKESVTIRDVTTLETTQAMLDLRFELGMPKTPCWDRSGSAFRSLFRRILDELQVSHLDFRPYSLRRGRATSEMQTHGLMSKTLIRGRWKTAMWPSYTYVMGWLCCRAFADLPGQVGCRSVVDFHQRSSQLCGWETWKETSKREGYLQKVMWDMSCHGQIRWKGSAMNLKTIKALPWAHERGCKNLRVP